MEKRYEIYSDIGTSINDLYCYFTYIGHWKEFTPDEIIIVKEQLDRKMYTYRPIMSKKLFKLYRDFLNALFEKRNISVESDNFSIISPRLRTSVKFRKEAAIYKGYEWNPKWEKFFTNETKRQNEIHKRYYSLLDHLATELKIVNLDA